MSAAVSQLEAGALVDDLVGETRRAGQVIVGHVPRGMDEFRLQIPGVELSMVVEGNRMVGAIDGLLHHRHQGLQAARLG